MSEWRLLLSGAGTGAYNMAVDEALLNGVIARTSPPTLRFYTWRRECLSFGFLQKVDDQIRKNCGNRGVEMVRRPTGGYAVLHGRDLCYSVAAPLAALGAFSPGEAFRLLGTALSTGLCHLGVPVALALCEERETLTTEKFSCAASLSLHEIVADGKKIAGSSSLRRKGHYLQHGSIFLEYDGERIAELLKGNDVEFGVGVSRSGGLRQGRGKKFPLTELISVLSRGFREELKVTLVPAGLEVAEENAVQKLLAEKYANLDYRRQRGRLSQQYA